MSPDIHLTYEQIAQLPVQVKALCAEHKIKVSPHADLSRMVDLCTDIDKKIDSLGDDQQLEVCRAQRILSAIAECSGEKELKEPLTRIASSILSTATIEPSEGKHAVFELEVLQYARTRGLTVRLDEPDVVITAPFGDYFVACKTINSLSNFETQVRSGCKQVEKYGHGCVMFNLEPHMYFVEPLRAQTNEEVISLLDSLLEGLYVEKSRFFDSRLQDGRLDGVALQISCIADVADSPLDLAVLTHTIYYSRPNLQGREAHDRFEGFRQSMKGARGQAVTGVL